MGLPKVNGSLEWLKRWWFLLVATAAYAGAFVKIQVEQEHLNKQVFILPALREDLVKAQAEIRGLRRDIDRLEKYLPRSMAK